MTEYDNDLLKEGILRYKAKEYDEARNFFERALDTADDMETRLQASLYLGRLTDDPQRKRRFLEDALAMDIFNAEARRELAILDGRLQRGMIVNPDKLPAQSAGREKVETNRFTCPKCGGRMVYTPDGVSLICEYCSRSENLATKPAEKQQDFIIAMADGRGFRKTVSVKTFQCGGCGATFLLPPKQLSATCAYCGSNHVLVLHGKKDLVEPDAILPMTTTPKQAEDSLSHWLKQAHIQVQGRVEAPAGVFLPIWSFDITGSIPWAGKIMQDKREQPVSGEKTFYFTNLGIPATRTMRELLVKHLPEYDLARACDFDRRFLAGWMAEIPEFSMAETSLDARQTAVKNVRALIRQDFDNVQDLTYATSGMSVVAFRLILLPAWILHISVQGQTARVFINGYCGAVHTDLPGQEPGWVETLVEGGKLLRNKLTSKGGKSRD
jgi:hypothetical protein